MKADIEIRPTSLVHGVAGVNQSRSAGPVVEEVLLVENIEIASYLEVIRFVILSDYYLLIH